MICSNTTEDSGVFLEMMPTWSEYLVPVEGYIKHKEKVSEIEKRVEPEERDKFLEVAHIYRGRVGMANALICLPVFYGAVYGIVYGLTRIF